ncbi:MAG: hypothetical protein R2827_15960 [Bdellovibrionales bacterium]
MIKVLITFVLLGLSPHVFSQYNSCSGSDDHRNTLDDLCPRMEGTELAGCCPQVFRTPPLQCQYRIVERIYGDRYYNSSYTVCEEDQNVTVSCCRKTNYSRECSRDPINKQFYPRLIHRRNQCCFEGCPPASYWRNPPNPDPNFSFNHELSTGSLGSCNDPLPEMNECSVDTECIASQRCPVPRPKIEPEDNPNNNVPPGQDMPNDNLPPDQDVPDNDDSPEEDDRGTPDPEG